LEHWGTQGQIGAEELVQFSGVRDPQTCQWKLQSRRHLIRPVIVDWVTDHVCFCHQHNDGNRVRPIVDSMPLFVLTVPGTRMVGNNATVLEDNVASTEKMCRMLGRHLAFANTLPPDRLPLKAPLLFCGERAHVHPCHTPGSFDCVKKVVAVVIPHGTDDDGNRIVDPPATQVPAVPTASASATGSAPGAGTGSGLDQNVALLQGALTAMQMMTQVQVQADQRNAAMTRQQAKLQAAATQSNAQQLKHLTGHLGKMGCEFGRAIASHPAQRSHTIQAALSHPSAVPGQSTDPQVLGSLTRPIPVGVSVSNFDCGPCAQAYQPQPNDKNTRRVDEATHQIIQRALPISVKIRCDAAHTSGVALPVSDHLDGFVCHVETAIDKQHQVVRKCFWHPALGTGCIRFRTSTQHSRAGLCVPCTLSREFGSINGPHVLSRSLPSCTRPRNLHAGVRRVLTRRHVLSD